MLDGVKKYLKECPLLKGGGINIEALTEPVKYSIEVMMVKPVIKNYADGASQRQYVFQFCSKEQMSDAGLKNLENAQFYEKFSDWVEEQNSKNNLPKFPEGKTAQSVEILTQGVLMSETGTTGRYAIQMRVIYYKAK